MRATLAAIVLLSSGPPGCAPTHQRVQSSEAAQMQVPTFSEAPSPAAFARVHLSKVSWVDVKVAGEPAESLSICRGFVDARSQPAEGKVSRTCAQTPLPELSVPATAILFATRLDGGVTVLPDPSSQAPGPAAPTVTEHELFLFDSVDGCEPARRARIAAHEQAHRSSREAQLDFLGQELRRVQLAFEHACESTNSSAAECPESEREQLAVAVARACDRTEASAACRRVRQKALDYERCALERQARSDRCVVARSQRDAVARRIEQAPERPSDLKITRCSSPQDLRRQLSAL